MGTHVIKMPDIGEGIAQVELVEWFVKVGDVIAEDQVVADVMTDKATVEIPSPVSGKVLALGGQPGEVMAVGSELIRIEVEGSGNHVDEPHAKPVETVAPAAPAPVAAAPRLEPQPTASPVSSASVAAPIVPRQAGENPWPPQRCASARWMPVSSCATCTAAARPGASCTKTSTPS